MKQKKMTKRQILNELLVVKEKQEKLDESQRRLFARKEKENANRRQLATELASLIEAEAKKAGKGAYDDLDVEEPILFKDHVFVIEQGGGYNNDRTSIIIQGAKSVK